MSEFGQWTAQAKPPTRKVSLQDAMAALLKAIAPSAPIASRASAEPETSVAEVPHAPVPPAPPSPPARAVEPERSYDIRDAIADVAAVAAPRAARKPAARVDAEWQPIATAPLDRDVQVGIHVEAGVLPIFFPCRRTEAGWTNAIVKAPLFHEPTCWREWPDATIPTR